MPRQLAAAPHQQVAGAMRLPRQVAAAMRPPQRVAAAPHRGMEAAMRLSRQAGAAC